MSDALDAFNGAIAIVDAHGFHNHRTGGRVALGGSHVHFFSQRLKWPPVVMLCACDTQPVARSVDTVASGVLLSGGRTVVATRAPVNAMHSAYLFAWTIAKLAFMTVHYPGPIRWSELFAYELWALHAVEAATVLARETNTAVPESRFNALEDAMRLEIGRLNRDWKQIAERMISEMLSMPIEDVRQWWSRYAYVTESCKYCLLGQADSVFFVQTEDWADAPPL